MMQLSRVGFSFIKSFEGFQSHVYLCPAGYKTIGYGHVLCKDEEFSTGISLFEAERLFWGDIRVAETAVQRLIAVSLRQGQFDALVSFAFNLGAGALQRSTLRRKINREEHDDVPQELIKWVWAGGKRLSGLIRRRQAEGVMYCG